MATFVTVIIISSVAIFCIGVCLLLYFLLKYMRSKKSNGKYHPQNKQRVNLADFRIPLYSPVKVQQTTDDLLPKLTVTNDAGKSRSLTFPRKFSNEYYESRKSKDDTAVVKDNRTSLSTPKMLRTQKIIAQHMFSRLRKQRKRGRSAYDDGRFSASSCDVSSNDSDGSSSMREGFTSANLGDETKRRIGRTRKRIETEELITEKFHKEGKLSFTSEYDQDTQIFSIYLLRLHEIAIHRDKNEINPFVQLSLIPGKSPKQFSTYKKHTNDIFINEQFIFTDIEINDFQKYKLKMKVFNHHKVRSNEVLGEVNIALTTFNPAWKERFEIDLFVKRPESSLASVLISLNHEVSYSKLQVTIEHAKHLPKGGHSSLPNPYAIVTLYREKKEEKKLTAVKRNTRDPLFNSTIDFFLITDIEKPLTTFSLAVTFMNRTLIGHDEILGHVIFSLSSPQHTALQQWKRVEKEPHKKHIVLHSMIDPNDV